MLGIIKKIYNSVIYHITKPDSGLTNFVLIMFFVILGYFSIR